MKYRIRILNSFVDPITMDASMSQIERFLEKGDKIYSVFAANPEKNYHVKEDLVLKKALDNADLLIPDGIGMVLAARILYGIRINRIPGIELMVKVCEIAVKHQYKVFFYGAKESVNKKAIDVMKFKYPLLKVAGRCNGYVKETDIVIEKINNSNTDILFLALGSPKQEKWFVNNKHKLKGIKICQGIGGSLDVIAGTVKRAPKIWRRMSAEWLYRLLKEPNRIKRQKVLPVFCLDVLRYKSKQISINLSSDDSMDV
jgi:N-acetylglucosaminyldiphosphoundecaprenol N-acetyl-beta-D-mannosaminyltransferase